MTTPPLELGDRLDGADFLDSLVRPGVDMAATFSLELLEGLHQLNLECNVNLSSVDMKYSKRMNDLVKYHHSMEKLVSMPRFSEFSNEDRTDVEANFHRSLKHVEQTRNKELRKVQTRCDSTQQHWLTDKFVSAVTYAKNILRSDRQRYSELIAEMASYKTKMQQHLTTCRHSEHSFGLMYCYVEELETLLDLLDKFLEVMDTFVVVYYGDDEDLSQRGQGSGVKEVDFSGAPPDTTQLPSPVPTSKILTIKLPPGFFGPGPVIIGPDDDAATPTNHQATPTREATPTKQVHTPETPTSTNTILSPAPPASSEAAPSQQSIGAEVSITTSPPQPHTTGDSSQIPASSPSPYSQGEKGGGGVTTSGCLGNW